MKKRLPCLLLVLLLCAAYTAASAETLHLFHGIPFSAGSFSEIEPMLTQTFGPLQMNEYGSYVLHAYGYDFSLRADFRGKLNCMKRILLGSTGDGYAEGEAFRDLVKQDIDMYMDLERQLTAEYGQPTKRYFCTVIPKVNRWKRYAFSDGGWEAERLMAVFDTRKYIEIHCAWGNVFLTLRSNGLDHRSRGYLTSLTIEFENEAAVPVSTTPYDPIQ